MQFNNIGVYGKFNDSSVADAVAQVKDFLEARQLTVLLGTTTAAEIAGARIEQHSLAIDLAIVVGGDGTMLNVARKLYGQAIPAIGVNLGRLGFLTDISLAKLEPSLNAVLAGDFGIEPRTMLHCQVTRDGEIMFQGVALNDTVLSKGNIGRLIEFEIRVNEQFVGQSRGDGVLVASPTGSTAYALSAGGPIIYPTLPALGLSLLCPHTVSNRPIMLSDEDVIEIAKITSAQGHSQANLILDGVLGYQLHGGEVVTVQKAPHKWHLIRLHGFNYFEALHAKLGWQR